MLIFAHILHAHTKQPERMSAGQQNSMLIARCKGHGELRIEGTGAEPCFYRTCPHTAATTRQPSARPTWAANSSLCTLHVLSLSHSCCCETSKSNVWDRWIQFISVRLQVCMFRCSFMYMKTCNMSIRTSKPKFHTRKNQFTFTNATLKSATLL